MRLVGLLAAIMLAMITQPAVAHFTPNSSIELDFGQRQVRARITVPVSELSYALGRRDLPMATFLSHLDARSPDGRRWMIQGVRQNIVTAQGPPDLIVETLLTPPQGLSTRRLTLHYDLLIDRIPNHIVLVFARSDFASGILQNQPQMIGALRQGQTSVEIDRGSGSGWRGFGAAIKLGMHHIAEGHDHLLFLMALLLPAPLLAAGGRWRGYGGVRPMLRKLAAVVTAFTIGHSITLIGGAFFGWKLDAQSVEIGIALSILVSAVHAWRPIFPGREAFVAGGFGLVHGLAFATIIGNFALDPLYKAQAILGFNLGIELVQLAVVAAVLPALIVLGQSPTYAAIRTVGAGFAGGAASAWALERVTGDANPVARSVDAGLGYALWPLVALALACLARLLWLQSRWAGR